MTPFERRLIKIHARRYAAAPTHRTVVRIIQDGELTQAQHIQVAEATAAGAYIIARVIVDPFIPSAAEGKV